MQHFTIGFLSFVIPLTLMLTYLAGFALRRLGAWSQREPGPKDRVGFFLTVAAVFGFVLGSFAQPLWDKAAACRATGQSVAACMFLPAGQDR